MLESAAAAACMPAHEEALNDLSLIPPVSVTMQPRNLADAAEPVAEAEVVGLVVDEAPLWLLPHAAMTSVADTASATVAHALCFTLTSTGPARYSAWPRIRPGLSRRLCLVVPAGKGTRGDQACSLPNRNPAIVALLAGQTYIQVFRPASWCLPTRNYRLTTSGIESVWPATALPELVLPALLLPALVLLAAVTPGKSRVTVRPPPGVSARLAVPPFEVTRRCTMARPRPVPLGLEVLKRRNARSRSSALMPGPSSATMICAPDAVPAVVTTTWFPALSASSALAIRLSRICSRCPSPIQARALPRPPSPPPFARDVASRAVARSTISRSSATGCHPATRSFGASARSTTAGTGTTFSARATA